MGNYVSCTLSGPLSKNPHRGTRVIFPSGEVRRLHEPTKAAELMLDAPNYFLADAKSLQIGRRFSPLSADEELELGHVYAFFPMKRAASLVNASDVGPLFMSSKRVRSSSSSSSSRVCGGVRVLPDSEEDMSGGSDPKLRLGELAEPEFVQRRSSFCRSKKPLLEPIAEEPISVR